ncbi:hypothetical protein FE257_002720 [Aspergillus nanangensis]|uniref:Uncharacterized protein n=1 Tax=Aspergillus nanangensis TaxID=2582783 RepID=A0AAD4CDR7_ASPNN|nr:hypothetical protein FE257_002720 [Aspergillus nanangensis]
MSYLLRTALRSSRAAGSFARPLSHRAFFATEGNVTKPRPWVKQPAPELGPPPELEGPVPRGVKLGTHRMEIDATGDKGRLYTLIRDSCKCSICVNPHSKQRNFRTTDIPDNITPRSIEWVEDKLEIKWSNDIKGYDASHTSTYDPATLRSPWAIARGSDIGRNRHRVDWNNEQMDTIQHWISYNDYINDDAKFATAMRQLALTGLIFVRDIPESREMVEKVATRMGPLRNTFYGSTWDVRTVPEAKNVAYTNAFLGFHMDLMYMNEPPGYQLLHCLQNSCDGGESLFVDGFRVAKEMAKKNPDGYNKLAKVWLNYEYNHKEHTYNNQWPVFEMEHGHLVHVNYSPPFQGPMHQMHLSGHVPRENFAALREFAEALEKEENTFELKLNPGECAIFENRRVLHARRQFNTSSGSRWLAGAYVDEDAVISRFKVCRNSQMHAWRTYPQWMHVEMGRRRSLRESS